MSNPSFVNSNDEIIIKTTEASVTVIPWSKLLIAERLLLEEFIEQNPLQGNKDIHDTLATTRAPNGAFYLELFPTITRSLTVVESPVAPTVVVEPVVEIPVIDVIVAPVVPVLEAPVEIVIETPVDESTDEE